MKKMYLIALCFVLMLFMASCGQSAGDSGSKETAAADAAQEETGSADSVSGSFTNAANDPNILTVVVSTDPVTVDPAMNTYFAAHQVSRHIYEPLFRLDEEFNLHMVLAEEYEQVDDTTLKIKLRDGIKFHNGDPLTPEDVLFSLKRSQDDQTAGYAYVENINFDKCEIIDDLTFTIVTDNPVANQVNMLAHAFTGIFSKAEYEAKEGDFFQKIAGTGPYVLDDYNQGDFYRLTSFDGYWDETQADRIPTINFRVITEGANRAIEAETGGADIVYDIVANDKERIQENPDLEYTYVYSANSNYIMLNTAIEPLNDIKVREAILYGLDRNLIVAMAYKNMGQLLDTFFSTGIVDSIEIKDLLIERDVEKAKALLAEAGYPDGFTVEFAAESNQTMRMDVAEAVQAQLAEIGIEVTLNFMDANAYSSYTANGSHGMCVYGLSCTTGEAGNGLQRFTPSMSYYTLTSHGDQAVLDAIEEGLRTIDPEKRHELFAQAQEGLMKDYCVLPIWGKEINAAVANYVDISDFYLDHSYETHLLTGVRFKTN